MLLWFGCVGAAQFPAGCGSVYRSSCGRYAEVIASPLTPRPCFHVVIGSHEEAFIG